MRTLLVVMAVVEAGAGLALLAAPSFVAVLLLGSSLEGGVSLIVARICGSGLLSLGIACLLGRGDAGAPAAGLITAMLVYNVITTALLAYAGFGLGLTGLLLWPAIVIHAALAIWCVVRLRSVPPVRA